jgi:hypothetical protein
VWLEQKENRRGRRCCGVRRRHYTLHETKDIPRDIDFQDEADARISVVRSGMGEEVWEEEWRKGRAMTLDEAVTNAMKGEEAGT